MTNLPRKLISPLIFKRSQSHVKDAHRGGGCVQLMHRINYLETILNELSMRIPLPLDDGFKINYFIIKIYATQEVRKFN